MGAPNTKKKFVEKIRWLANKGVIPENDILAWDAVRALRNSSSHPERQSIIVPGMAIGSLERLTEIINALFSRA